MKFLTHIGFRIGKVVYNIYWMYRNLSLQTSSCDTFVGIGVNNDTQGFVPCKVSGMAFLTSDGWFETPSLFSLLNINGYTYLKVKKKCFRVCSQFFGRYKYFQCAVFFDKWSKPSRTIFYYSHILWFNDANLGCLLSLYHPEISPSTDPI